MMKRIMIGLIALGGIALGGVALWWTDASAQCAGGVGIGGSCITRGILGRSLVGITRSLDPGDSTFEFFGTVGHGCHHNFKKGELDCNCRITGTAYCTPADKDFSVSGANGNTHRRGHDDDDDGGDDDDDDDDDDGGGSQLKKKRQILPAELKVNNIGNPAGTSESKGGDPQTGDSYLAVAELEPPTACVSCPSKTEFLTFIADEVVVRSTFCPDGHYKPCHTAIQVCKGGKGLDPTEIGSYDCQTVFECTERYGQPCSRTIGRCDETCERK